jgi:hypothetical protein
LGIFEYNSRHRSKSFRNKIREITPDRWVELLIAFAVVVFACLQYRSSQSTTLQTNQLIKAANISAAAAEQNVQASQNFADSAKKINKGIADAVVKLNLQAATTNRLAEQTSVQARAATVASETAKRALEAGLSRDRARLEVQNLKLISVGSTVEPVEFSFDFINSGRTPTINPTYVITGPYSSRTNESDRDIEQAIKMLERTTYQPHQVPDIPGPGSFSNTYRAVKRMNQLDYLYLHDGDYSPFFIGKVEYEDIFGGKEWETFCVRILQRAPKNPGDAVIPTLEFCPVGKAREPKTR